MEFAEVINASYDPKKNEVFKAFVEYFNNPLMVKIKNVSNFSMYCVKIYAMLGNAYRYLIVLTDRDFEELGFKKHLNDIEWVSLQTRTLQEKHIVPTHSYPKNLKPPLNDKISVQSRTEDASTYKAEKLPLVITLLNTRKNNKHQYSPSGTIVSALETFQTIINFDE